MARSRFGVFGGDADGEFGCSPLLFLEGYQEFGGGTVRSIAERNYQSRDLQLTLGLIIGTLPLGILGLLLKKTLNAPNSPLRGLVVIGVASIVMSLLLALAEFQGTRERGFGKLTLKDGLLVGIAQALALIPGVSRSDSTLTAGLFLGMEREAAAKFSFLLGLPAVTLAGAIELHALFKAGLGANGWFVLVVGLTSASISAFLAIYGLLRVESRAGIILRPSHLDLDMLLSPHPAPDILSLRFCLC